MNKLFQMNTFKLAVILCATLCVAGCKRNETVAPSKEKLVLANGSKALWKGYLETGYFNSGSIELNGQDIYLEGNTIVGGQISIPVSSILITNNLSVEEKAQLLHHLQTPDFFNLAVYPHVTYTIVSAEKKSFADELGSNYLIKGYMKLLNKEIALDIPAKINISNTAVSVVSKFNFDRTKWGMTFASADGLPPNEKIKNNIEVDLELTATRF